MKQSWLRKLLGIRSPSRELVESLEKGRAHVNLGEHDCQNCDTCKSLATIQNWWTSEYVARREMYIWEALGDEETNDEEEKLPEGAEDRDGTSATGGQSAPQAPEEVV